jgi:hypothetical protein
MRNVRRQLALRSPSGPGFDPIVVYRIVTKTASIPK